MEVEILQQHQAEPVVEELEDKEMGLLVQVELLIAVEEGVERLVRILQLLVEMEDLEL